MVRASFLAAAAMLSTLATPASALAQDFYIGQIIYAAYNFCPRYTLEADGRLLQISSNTALFSLLGTTYGGDGRRTFALPDLRNTAKDDKGQPLKACIAVSGIFPSRGS